MAKKIFITAKKISIVAMIIISALYIVLQVMSLMGCKKETKGKVAAESHPSSPPMKTVSRPAFTYYEYGKDITEDDFLKNPDDARDEAFNYVAYALSLCLLELYNHHPALLDDLKLKIDGTRNKCYNMFVFAEDHPEVNKLFDSVFVSRFGDITSYNNSWKQYVAANYNYDVAYTPFARFANEENVDVAEQPYVAAPFEINEEKFTAFKNNIPLWIKDETGMKFSAINEAQSKIVSNPIILITNGHAGDESSLITKIDEEETAFTPVTCTFPDHLHEYLTHHYFKINHRYERTGDSEYKVAWISRAAYRHDLHNWENVTKLATRSKDVNKNDIGKLIHWEFIVFGRDMYASPRCFEIQQMALSQNLYKSYAVGAYEYDWYAGHMQIFYATGAYGDEKKYGVKRTYESEWYYLDPETNRSYPFNVRNPTQHSTYYNYTKGELRLHRWNL